MIEIDGTYYNLKIERKNNRNIYLRIKGDTLCVTCPRWVNKEDILKFIEEKSDWIKESVTKNTIKKARSKLSIGDNIYYLGKKYRFIVFEGNNTMKVYEDCIIIYCKLGSVENAIKLFYKESKKVLLELINQLEPKYLDIIKDYGYNLKPEYKIKLLTSMWGVNYTKKNQININERLIHFEPRCLEAILWHELLHFVIPNHSKRFHEVLEYHMNDYEEIIDSIY